MSSTRIKGILILSHQGYSFLEDLAKLIRAKGLAVLVLSSRPAQGNEHRWESLSQISDWCRIIEEYDALNIQHGIESLDELNRKNYEVVGCISVWDGYRCIMAHLNRELGVPDLHPEVIASINDKFKMRQNLKLHGLTHSSSQIATPESFGDAIDDIKKEDRRVFVKPRRGLASFASFEMTPDLTWQELEDLRKSITSDPEYASVLSEHKEFILEDFIEGQEFSFEMGVFDGKAYVLGIHEKVGLQCAERTTLETVCVSPPPSLSQSELLNGIDYIRNVLKVLQANNGLFHVEARRSANGDWDTIEVNPRVGGAFINESAKSLSGGSCLLDQWLNILLGYSNELKFHELQVLARPWCTTLFRVFFGESGRKILKIEQTNIEPKPRLSRIISRNGERLHKSEREIFIAQLLWTLPYPSNSSEIKQLVNNSALALEIKYDA